MHTIPTTYKAKRQEGPTKAESIRELFKQGHTTRVIAELVYELAPNTPSAEVARRVAYVRAVCHQRTDESGNPCWSDILQRYRRTDHGRAQHSANQRVFMRGYRARKKAEAHT